MCFFHAAICVLSMFFYSMSVYALPPLVNSVYDVNSSKINEPFTVVITEEVKKKLDLEMVSLKDNGGGEKIIRNNEFKFKESFSLNRPLPFVSGFIGVGRYDFAVYAELFSNKRSFHAKEEHLIPPEGEVVPVSKKISKLEERLKNAEDELENAELLGKDDVIKLKNLEVSHVSRLLKEEQGNEEMRKLRTAEVVIRMKEEEQRLNDALESVRAFEWLDVCRLAFGCMNHFLDLRSNYVGYVFSLPAMDYSKGKELFYPSGWDDYIFIAHGIKTLEMESQPVDINIEDFGRSDFNSVDEIKGDVETRARHHSGAIKYRLLVFKGIQLAMLYEPYAQLKRLAASIKEGRSDLDNRELDENRVAFIAFLFCKPSSDVSYQLLQYKAASYDLEEKDGEEGEMWEEFASVVWKLRTDQ